MNDIKKKHLLIVWGIHVVLAILVLTLLQYQTFDENNQIKAFKTSELIIGETQEIIAGNDADRDNLHEYLKTNYLEKSRTAAYILDMKPELLNDLQGLQTLAQDLSVDQIHIFDPDGFICSTTDPQYLGLSMDAGEQIRFFKPMLKDPGLALSQNITPNTAEGRVMLYAACWNGDGTKIVQVGAYGERFPRILNRNRIDMFLDLVPNGPSSDIILTDRGEETIVAATSPSLVGKRLQDVGITLPENLGEEIQEFTSGFSYDPVYCSAMEHKDFTIVIAQYKHQVNSNIPLTLFTFVEYLILVFIAMTFLVNYYYDRFLQEKSYAMKDKLTDLYSRRAYESALSDLEEEEEGLPSDLVFVSMDVNGLKRINDTLGHQTGDTLLQGAAACMRKCFSPYGKVFRFGGDEFAAIIYAKEVELQPLQDYLAQLCGQWSRQNSLELSVSLGFASMENNPQATIQNLESLADQHMYADKRKFYSSESHNRRRNPQ